MNVLEIDESINDIQKALGFVVQGVYFNNKTLVLKLWQKHVSYILVLSVRQEMKGVYLLNNHEKSKFKIEKKPLQLFAEKYLKNTVFTDITRNELLGRSVDLVFSSQRSDDIHVNVNLIPSSLNISILNGSKIVHLLKPKIAPEMKPINYNLIKTQSLDGLKIKWINDLWPDKSDRVKLNRKGLQNVNLVLEKSQVQLEVEQEKILIEPSEKTGASSFIQIEIEKKKKVLNKVLKSLEEKTKDNFYDFAMLLDVNKDEARIKFPEYFDERKNIQKLKNEYFKKHKQVVEKKRRIEDRILVLKKEIDELGMISNNVLLTRKPTFKDNISTDFKSKIKTRKLDLSQDLVAYIGKSAADNLKLLRSAKSWHLWFHIKDVPSAHMIVFRDKNRVLTESETKKSCEWFLSEVVPKSKSKLGELFEILITECRHVKPIKGDKIGRVNYSNEQVYRLRL